MVPWKQESVIEIAVEQGIEFTVYKRGVLVQGEDDPLLRLYPAYCSSGVLVVQGALEGVEILDRRLHVLVVGQILEVAVCRGAKIDAESSRPVDYESVIVVESEGVSLPADLRRAEEVVEVGAVVVAGRRPSASGVFEPEVRPFILRQVRVGSV